MQALVARADLLYGVCSRLGEPLQESVSERPVSVPSWWETQRPHSGYGSGERLI